MEDQQEYNSKYLCVTVPKRSELKSKVYIAHTEDFDLADALESVYPLLEIVFSYLDYADLKRASLVKRSWQIAADIVLHKRNQLSWITVFMKRGQSCVHPSIHYPYTNIAWALVLFNKHALSLNGFFCYHDNLSQCQITFSDFLADEIVPSGVKYCTLACVGLVAMFPPTLITNASYHFNCYPHTSIGTFTPLFVCCFIPPIPNVRVSMFYCNSDQLRYDQVKPNEKVKCLLFFCVRKFNLYKILDRLLPKRDSQDVAIGGGLIAEALCHPQDISREPESEQMLKRSKLCIAFTEDIYCESVFSASSIVITNGTIKEFKADLLQFKRRIIIRSRSFAFIICSTERANKSHQNRIFNKVFPNTPSMGMETDEKIGWSSFNNSSGNEDGGENVSKRIRMGYAVAHHSESTVIVFLTWGQVVRCQD